MKFILTRALIFVIILSYGNYHLAQISSSQTNETNQKNLEESNLKLRSVKQGIDKINQELLKKKADEKEVTKQINKLRAEIKSLNSNYNQSQSNLEKIREELANLDTNLKKSNQELFANQHKRSIVFATVLKIEELTNLIMIKDYDKVLSTKLLINSLIPQLLAKENEIQQEVSQISAKKIELSKKQEELKQANQHYNNTKKQYSTLIKEKENLALISKNDIKKLQTKVSNLTEESNNLTDLISNLSYQQEVSSLAGNNPNLGKLIKNFPSKSEKAMLPAADGKQSLAFGQEVDGIKSKAMSFKLNKKNHIVAPFDGVITFASDFKDFGKMVIISHKQDYFSVVYGVDELIVNLGQWVLRGEIMGYSSLEVFQELRKGSLALNPKDFMIQ